MLENQGINPAMAIASIITQFNTFIQADISKENYCLITLFILPWEKKPTVFLRELKFILR
jgi:hypothetical protein